MQEEQKETAAGSPVASFQTRRDKPIEVMSLQEKFIELRRQIPRIEKGQHSEEVPYKFAKIDDVWRAITPTMNELGVNFDIIQEENAQIKTMNTQHGGLMFLYESDLTMRWTNADNEDEQEKAEAAAGELVPGRDFDPDTGEVFENGRPPVDQPTTTEQPKSNQHKVITMGPKAVNA